MKTAQLFIGLLTLVSILSGCSVKMKEYNKNNPTKEIPVKAFNAINSSGVADVIYTQSENTRVSVTAPEDFMEFVNIQIKDNILHISTENGHGKKCPKVIILVSSPELTLIKYSAVGDIKLQGKILLSRLDINNEAVGDIKIENLDCKNLRIETKAVGDIELNGTAKTATYLTSAVGDINAYNFKVGSLAVESSAVGNIECNASELSIDNQGVGDIKYKGNPIIKRLNNSGVGRVKPVD